MENIIPGVSYVIENDDDVRRDVGFWCSVLSDGLSSSVSGLLSRLVIVTSHVSLCRPVLIVMVVSPALMAVI